MKKYFSLVLNYIIIFIIATEGLFIGQFAVLGIAWYRWIELLLFVLVSRSFIKDLKVNKLIRFYVIFIMILVFFLILKVEYLIFFENYMNNDPFRHVMRVLYFIIVPYLGFYIIRKDLKYLKIILFIQLLIFLVAFFQFPLTPFTDLAWQLKNMYFSLNTPLGIYNEGGEELLKGRVCGLYGYAIPLSYVLISAGIVSTYLYQNTKNNIYIFAILYMLIIGAMSLTRSVVLGLLLLFVYTIFVSINKNKTIKIIIYSIIIFVFIQIFMEYSESFSRLSTTSDNSSTGRFPLLITGIYTLLLNPLGVSPENYQTIKDEMFLVFNHPNILEFTAHNGLVNFGFYYTFIGLLMFIVYIYIFNNMFLSKFTKQKRRLIGILFIAYMLQASFHNNFIFTKDFNILIFISIIMYEYTINRKIILTKKKL